MGDWTPDRTGSEAGKEWFPRDWGNLLDWPPLQGCQVIADGTVRAIAAGGGLSVARQLPELYPDIAVLSLAGQTRSNLLEKTKLGTLRLSRADATDASEHVVADTFLRFKGLERPFVIVTDLVHGDGMKYDVRMHIALTRATAGVIVVCGEKDLARDPRLARVAGKS